MHTGNVISLEALWMNRSGRKTHNTPLFDTSILNLEGTSGSTDEANIVRGKQVSAFHDTKR